MLILMNDTYFNRIKVPDLMPNVNKDVFLLDSCFLKLKARANISDLRKSGIESITLEKRKINQRMLANQSIFALFVGGKFQYFPCKFPQDFFLNGLREIKVNINVNIYQLCIPIHCVIVDIGWSENLIAISSP